MGWLTGSRGWRRRAQRPDPDAELARELAAWVAELAARHEARGVPPGEARRLALIETEGVEQVKEQVRDARRLSPARMADRMRSDAAAAVRGLRGTPVATAAAIVTLAVAVGVNVAMFGLIDRALLSPPAHVADPHNVFVLALHGADGPAGGIRTAAPFPTFSAIRDGVPALAAAAAFQPGYSTTAIIDGDQRSVRGMTVSSEYFELLGVRPALGRGLTPDPGTHVCFVSHAFWHAAFGGDRRAIGRRVRIGSFEYAVGGVMPPGFSGHTAETVDVWVTFAGAMRESPGWDHNIHASLATILVRLGPAGTEAAVKAQTLAAIQQQVSLRPIAGTTVGATETRVAWWLAGVSVLVLIVGLANVGTLLVVRAIKRRGDVAIQTALGATRGRLLSQTCIEAGLLALAATSLSLLAASWLDETIRRVVFPGVIAQAGLTTRTVWSAAFAGAVAAAVASFASLSQLPSASRSHALAARGRSTGRSRSIKALLVAQTSLAMLLLAGAGVFARSLHNLVSQDFGMTMDRVVIVQFENEGPSVRGGFDRVVESIRALPGVEIVTPIAGVPFGGRHVPPISVPGLPEPPSVGRQLPFLNAATPEFMEILGIRVAEGRSFTAADDRGAPVVIVNETMAREVWPGERALGKCIRIGFDPDFDPESTRPPWPVKVPCREIVGIARDIRQRSLLPAGNEARLMQYFVPFSQVPYPPFMAPGPTSSGLLLRTSADLDTLAPAIRRVIVGDRTDLPFVRVAPYAQLLEPQLRPWRMATTLLGLFSALALSVALVGLHAAFAHAVAERRQEMAIRAAMGADPARVRRLVLREALLIAGSGVVAGATAAVFAGRSIQALLFETAPSDPVVLGAAAAVMLVVAAGATWIPARTASKADPSALLKSL